HADIPKAESVGIVNQPHELIGMMKRQRAEEDGIHNAEDRGVGSDAEGQCQDDDDGESGGSAQGAEAIGDVLKERSHSIFDERFVDSLFAGMAINNVTGDSNFADAVLPGKSK